MIYPLLKVVVLKSPAIILLSISICLIYLTALMLGACPDNDTKILFVSLTVVGLKSVLSDTSIATPALFWFPPAGDILIFIPSL